MSEPKARAAESGRQGELHVTVRCPPHGGGRLIGAPPFGIELTSRPSWVVHR